MTDKLTQLQDCLDQLLDRMYATVHYVGTYHSYAGIEGQTDQNPWTQPPQDSQQPPAAAPQRQGSLSGTAQQAQSKQQQAEGGDGDGGERPHDAAAFARNLALLSQDLVLKEQQIEAVVDALPGVGRSQEHQERRIAELESQLQKLGPARERAAREREALERRLESAVLGVRRV